MVGSMPGFIGSVNPALTVSEGWSKVFSLSFVLGFFLGKFDHVLCDEWSIF